MFKAPALDQATYRISKVTNGIREDFAAGDASVRPFRPRSSEGFVFNTLLPGDYTLEISMGEQVTKSVNFSVSKDKVTDLGEIRL